MMSRGRTAKEDPRTRLARRGVSRVLYIPLHARTGVSIRARSRWTGSSRSRSARCGGCCTSTSMRPRSARSIRGSEAAGWSGKASPSPSAARCSRNPRLRSERFGSWGEGSGRRGRTRSSRRCGSRTKSDSRTVRRAVSATRTRLSRKAHSSRRSERSPRKASRRSWGFGRPGDSSTARTTRTSRTPTSRNEPPTGIKKAKPTPSIDGPRWIDGPTVPPMRHEQPRRIAFLPVLRGNALGPDGGRAAARRHRADLHALLGVAFFLLVLGVVFYLNQNLLTDLRQWWDQIVAGQLLFRPPEGVISSAVGFWALIGVTNFVVAALRWSLRRTKIHTLGAALGGVGAITFAYLLYRYSLRGLSGSQVVSFEAAVIAIMLFVYIGLGLHWTSTRRRLAHEAARRSPR